MRTLIVALVFSLTTLTANAAGVFQTVTLGTALVDPVLPLHVADRTVVFNNLVFHTANFGWLGGVGHVTDVQQFGTGLPVNTLSAFLVRTQRVGRFDVVADVAGLDFGFNGLGLDEVVARVQVRTELGQWTPRFVAVGDRALGVGTAFLGAGLTRTTRLANFDAEMLRNLTGGTTTLRVRATKALATGLELTLNGLMGGSNQRVLWLETRLTL